LNLPFHIASRYLVAKKSHNAINIISIISVMGVTVGTMALIVILSVFNGFDNLVRSLINSFNPDLKISLVEGKVFQPGEETLARLKAVPGVLAVSFIVEDKALVRYEELQTIAVVKGVSDNFPIVSGLDSMVVEGDYRVSDSGEPFALIGKGISIYLNVRTYSPRQMTLYVPRRLKQPTLDAGRALNRQYISVGGVFSIEQDFDLRYIVVPLGFARDLFEYRNGEVSALEVKTDAKARADKVQAAVEAVMGKDFRVENRYQQNDVFYKTMQTEKWAIFLILFFILVVASFNVIGTLTMLMLEKKKDIVTLRNLGADAQLLRRIFLLEGWLISASGAVAGTGLGLLICFLQQHFGLIRLQGSGSFIIDAYPVLVRGGDVVLVLVSVTFIGLAAAWFPIRMLTRNYVEELRDS
jgi:lipoprotein-releasing system permease protein